MFIGKVFIPLNVTTTATETGADISPEFAIVLIVTLSLAGLVLLYTIASFVWEIIDIKISNYRYAKSVNKR